MSQGHPKHAGCWRARSKSTAPGPGEDDLGGCTTASKETQNWALMNGYLWVLLAEAWSQM